MSENSIPKRKSLSQTCLECRSKSEDKCETCVIYKQMLEYLEEN